MNYQEMFILDRTWLSPSTAFKLLERALTSLYAFTFTAILVQKSNSWLD